METFNIYLQGILEYFSFFSENMSSSVKLILLTVLPWQIISYFKILLKCVLFAKKSSISARKKSFWFSSPERNNITNKVYWLVKYFYFRKIFYLATIGRELKQWLLYMPHIKHVPFTLISFEIHKCTLKCPVLQTLQEGRTENSLRKTAILN